MSHVNGKSKPSVFVYLFAFVIIFFVQVPTSFSEGVQSLSPEIHEALRAQAAGKATPKQKALLFANNAEINRARLVRQIPDNQYQSAQELFKKTNQEFAAQAANDVGAKFEVQKSKSSRSQPGTDSDYITKVKSAQQIEEMQKGYNKRVNEYLKDNGVITVDRNDWHKRNDTDFMADSKGISKAEFEKVAPKNNDAYRRPDSASWEYKSRNPEAGPITQNETTQYVSEMEEFRNKKQRQIKKIQGKGVEPGSLDEGKLIQKQAQQQKYNARIGDADARYRMDHGLSTAKNPTHDLAKTGAIREPDVTPSQARKLLGKKPGMSLSEEDMALAQQKFDAKRQAAFSTEQNIHQNAKRSAAEGIMEKASIDSEVDHWMKRNGLSDPNTASLHSKKAAKDAAQIMENMPPSEKGRFMSELQDSLPKNSRTGDLTAESRALMNDLRNEMRLRPGARPSSKISGADIDLPSGKRPSWDVAPADVAVIGDKAKVTAIDNRLKPSKPNLAGAALTGLDTGLQVSEATAKNLGKILDRENKNLTGQDIANIAKDASGISAVQAVSKTVRDTRLKNRIKEIELKEKIRALTEKKELLTPEEQRQLATLKLEARNADSTLKNLSDLAQQMVVDPEKEIISRRMNEMESNAKAEGRKPEFIRDGLPAMAKIAAENVGKVTPIGSAAEIAAEISTFDARSDWSEQKKYMTQHFTAKAIQLDKQSRRWARELEGLLQTADLTDPAILARIEKLLNGIATNKVQMDKVLAAANGQLSEVDPKKLGPLRALARNHLDPNAMRSYANQKINEAKLRKAEAEKQRLKDKKKKLADAKKTKHDNKPMTKAQIEEALTERITEIMLSEPDPAKRKILIKQAIRELSGNVKKKKLAGNSWGEGEWIDNNTSEKESGWGDGEYQQPSSADHYISQITTANNACDYERALRLTYQAYAENPGNTWLKQNIGTIQVLAKRSNIYHQQLNIATSALKAGDYSASVSALNTAMQNASTQCGQDAMVRSLHEQAIQIAQMERNSIIEKARWEAESSAYERERARQRYEQNQAERMRNAHALQGALLGVLRAVNQGGGSHGHSGYGTGYRPSTRSRTTVGTSPGNTSRCQSIMNEMNSLASQTVKAGQYHAGLGSADIKTVRNSAQNLKNLKRRQDALMSRARTMGCY